MSTIVSEVELSPPGFVKAVLGKPWMDYKVGDHVWVDPERKAWLEKNGYLSIVAISGFYTDNMKASRTVKEAESHG